MQEGEINTQTGIRPKISFVGAQKRYSGKGASEGTLALDSFDFDIAPAEIVSIVGPTGCGKSTALNILAGFERPSAGAVSVVFVESRLPLDVEKNGKTSGSENCITHYLEKATSKITIEELEEELEETESKLEELHCIQEKQQKTISQLYKSLASPEGVMQ